MVVKFRCGKQIRVEKVRYIDHQGTMHGIIATSEAMAHAEAAGLTLVEVDPNASPPVCKSMDYNRFQYERKKKAKNSNASSVKKDKEVKFNTSTGENDYQVKLRKVLSLLDSGHRVKVSVRFRFRRDQRQTPETPEIVNRIVSDLSAHEAKMEGTPKLDGRQAVIYFLKKK